VPSKISPATICKTGEIAIYTAGGLAKVSASKAITPRQNETKQNEDNITPRNTRWLGVNYQN